MHIAAVNGALGCICLQFAGWSTEQSRQFVICRKNNPREFHLLQSVHGCWCSVGDQHWANKHQLERSGSITPPRPKSFHTSTRLSTSADQPTPWLRICPLERLGPHAPPPKRPLVPLRRLFPVAPSLRTPNLRPARQSSPDGPTRRHAQRRHSVSDCTPSAHSST